MRNLCFPLAIYANVCAYLNEPFAFPGDIKAFQNPMSHSSAILNAHYEEWAALSKGAKNQRLNCSDGSAFTYERYCPEEEGLTEVEWGYYPTPRGYGPKGKLHFQVLPSPSGRAKGGPASLGRAGGEKHGLVYKEIKTLSRNFGFLGLGTVSV
ncbi:hypothetical protein NW754_016745 [Fusarium falciforme]|nr:hypothetical protein NW754_016745 [Fusarium falciforme]